MHTQVQNYGCGACICSMLGTLLGMHYITQCHKCPVSRHYFHFDNKEMEIWGDSLPTNIKRPRSNSNPSLFHSKIHILNVNQFPDFWSMAPSRSLGHVSSWVPGVLPAWGLWCMGCPLFKAFLQMHRHRGHTPDSGWTLLGLGILSSLVISGSSPWIFAGRDTSEQMI